jgi:hypothetical protein
LSGPVETAREAWGTELPDWVLRLAEECGRTSQNAVAKRLGRSGAMVSQIIRRNYKARLDNIEELVRGALMNGTHVCPARGEIPMDECQQWRARARNFSGHNMQQVRMYRACTKCPRFMAEASE